MLRFRQPLFAALCLIGLALPAGADPALEKGAAKFVEGLSVEAIRSLANDDIQRSERVARFRQMFNQHFAVQGIARWVLGRYWSAASPAQQTEYLTLFEDMVVSAYVDRFAEYAGETLRVRNATTIDQSHASVQTEIVRPTGPPVTVDWRVGATGSTYKVVDVVVEGTSMSTTMRSDFGSIIRRNGGELEGLLEELRRKTESLRSAQ
jgi:phospholipid transport system substrate-binding protein